MKVPNGDMIVVGNSSSDVIYHDGDKMHGKILGATLWKFLEFYSNIGFAGSEDRQIETFFDFDTNQIISIGEKNDRFIKLLEK